MKTSSLSPKSAAKAGGETRTAFAVACALYLPCLTLAVWGASLAPAPASVGAEGIMLAVAQFESAVAAPATAAEPAAEPEPKQAAEPELKPELEPRPEPEPEPEPQPEPERSRRDARPHGTLLRRSLCAFDDGFPPRAL